jgi:hypothetical protein
MSDESLFREVDEEVRQEEVQRFFTRHGKLLGSLAIALVVGVAGYEGFKFWRKSTGEAASVIYHDALKKADDGKSEDAIAALKAVPAGSGFAPMAALAEAELLAKDGKASEAVAAYDAFAAKSTDPVLQNLAKLKAAYLLLDTAKPEELASRVQSFDVAKSPWRHQAREILGLASWRAGNYAEAKKYMNAIAADLATPAAMRQRTQMVLELLAAKTK